MRFEWDERKALANIGKHGVAFARAVSVLEDVGAVTPAGHRGKEPRLVTIGKDGLGQVLVVVYTWRMGCIRIISARRASRQERKKYEG